MLRDYYIAKTRFVNCINKNHGNICAICIPGLQITIAQTYSIQIRIINGMYYLQIFFSVSLHTVPPNPSITHKHLSCRANAVDFSSSFRSISQFAHLMHNFATWHNSKSTVFSNKLRIDSFYLQ